MVKVSNKQAANEAASAQVPAAPNSVSTSSKKSGRKNAPAIGGTAVAGARSTIPKTFDENANAQQQQLDSYNRDMRRRMTRMGYDENKDQAKSVQTTRQKRMARLKERRQAQLAQLKKSLPGGKIDTNTNRVYIMIAAVAVLIVLLIVIFVILHSLHIIGG